MTRSLRIQGIYATIRRSCIMLRRWLCEWDVIKCHTQNASVAIMSLPWCIKMGAVMSALTFFSCALG